jgi:hypothetical protein
MPDKVLDIVTDVLTEIEAYQVGEDVDPADAQRVLRILNRELDAWAALDRYVYAVTFTQFTLTPNHQPHLIGPGLAAPDFPAAQRPVRVDGASIVLSGNPSTDVIMNLRDRDWWNNQRVKDVQTTTPTNLYYEPSYPNGSLFLWPVPTVAYGILLELWGLISQFTGLEQPFDMAPGYKKALVLTTAEQCCRPFGRPLRPDLVAAANKARVAIQTNNLTSPRTGSADYGASGSGSLRRGDFNYTTGGPA